jgi:hypothetical protein
MLTQLTKLAVNSTMLALETQEVVYLRIAKLASGGPGAFHESHLMITEKVIALGEAAMSTASGRSPDSIVSAYRDKVSANLRRLS